MFCLFQGGEFRTLSQVLSYCDPKLSLLSLIPRKFLDQESVICYLSTLKKENKILQIYLLVEKFRKNVTRDKMWNVGGLPFLFATSAVCIGFSLFWGILLSFLPLHFFSSLNPHRRDSSELVYISNKSKI